MIRSAMIFAAGLGTRLRPLTDVLPKPLVPVLNRPIIYHILDQLERLGIEEVVINLHYLGDEIVKYVLKKKWNFHIHFSFEKEQILGTAGGLAAVEPFLKNEDNFIIINGDILFQFDLLEMIERHLESSAAATLAVTEFNSRKGKPLGVDKRGFILSVPEMTPTPELTPVGFTGIHITSGEIFQFLRDLPPPPSCIIRTAYRRMLESGRSIRSHYIPPYRWSDIGTPKDYLQANLKLLGEKNPIPSILIGKNSKIEDTVSIDSGVIVGNNVNLIGTFSLKNSVVWPNVKFQGRGFYENTVIYTDKEPPLKVI